MKLKSINFSKNRVISFCQKWKIHELALFGSILGDNFSTESDVDILVTFSREAHWSLFDQISMEEELSKIFGRKVDLINRKALERSSNWIRRKAILETARPCYVKR